MTSEVADIPPEVQTTALAVLAAPEGMEHVVAEIPIDKLLPTLWFCEELLRRANSLKKALIIEATVAIERLELTDPRISVGGHTFMLREGSRMTWSDLARLLGALERDYGIATSDLRTAVSDARVTDLRELASRIPDPDKRADALELIEGARAKRSTGLALVDLDSPYRRR